ncbi:MAG: glycosyltransferase family 2 protein [Cyanobacteriota bacterium]|nr:glycosyltransferase family 2 protein [Cyanobacteriota bacterium]
MSPPDISVIVPAFQGRATIALCLNAVLRATKGFDAEIIVVESSGDGTAALVRDGFPRVRLIESPGRLTAGQARNWGIRQARGRWLFCVDQDCLVPPNWIPALLRHLDQEGVGAAGGSMAVANPDNLSGWCVYFLEFLTHFPRQQAPPRRDNFLIGANSAWRAEALAAIRFPDQTLGEDRLFSEAVRQQGWAVVYDASVPVWHHNRRGWTEFRRYCRAMGRAAAQDQQKLGGRAIRWIQRWPPLVYGVPLVVLPLIAWRLLGAPPSYLLRYLTLLPCCLLGQLLWAQEFAKCLAGKAAGRTAMSLTRD